MDEAEPLPRVLAADDEAGKLYEHTREREEDYGRADLQESVGVGKLLRGVRRGEGGDPIGERQELEKYNANDAGEHVEHHVYRRGAFRVLGAVHRRDDGDHRAADVLTADEVDGLPERQNVRRRHRLQNAHGGGNGLEQHSHYCAEEHAYNGVILKALDKGAEPFLLPKIDHVLLHEHHAHEEHSETGDDVKNVVPRLFLHERHSHNAHKGDYGGYRVHVEGDELTGDGGTDVGAHYDAGRVFKRHEPRVDKADRHNGNGVGALYYTGDDYADYEAQKAIFGKCFKYFFELRSGKALDTVTHYANTVKEQRDAARNTYPILKSHSSLQVCLHSKPV